MWTKSFHSFPGSYTLWLVYLTILRTVSGQKKPLRSCRGNVVNPGNSLFLLLANHGFLCNQQNKFIFSIQVQESMNYEINTHNCLHFSCWSIMFIYINLNKSNFYLLIHKINKQINKKIIKFEIIIKDNIIEK